MIVAHLDLDAFFAAVEELEAPELRRKPLVVGPRRPEHLEPALRALDLHLTPDERAALFDP